MTFLRDLVTVDRTVAAVFSENGRTKRRLVGSGAAGGKFLLLRLDGTANTGARAVSIFMESALFFLVPHFQR
jgi:hypothetical protein